MPAWFVRYLKSAARNYTGQHFGLIEKFVCAGVPVSSAGVELTEGSAIDLPSSFPALSASSLFCGKMTHKSGESNLRQ
jgi:hypothetical protein